MIYLVKTVFLFAVAATITMKALGCTNSNDTEERADCGQSPLSDSAVDGAGTAGEKDALPDIAVIADTSQSSADTASDYDADIDATLSHKDASDDAPFIDTSVDAAFRDAKMARDVVGVIQKGPFISGTTVTLQELDGALVPNGRAFVFETMDDLGRFSIPSSVTAQYVEIIASGYYFDEVSGQLSSAKLTLRGLSDLTASATVNVNLLTSLAVSRERALVASGKSFQEARSQAEGEVLSALSFSISANTTFDQMDISRGGDSNAILIAASVALEQLGYLRNAASPVAELSQLLAKMGTDIADNGVHDDVATASTLRCIAPARVDASLIRGNLERRYGTLDAGVTLPDFETLLVVPASCCIPDKLRCSGDIVQRCDATGRWQDAIICSGATPYCKDTNCEAPCTLGERRCAPIAGQSCDSAGRWQDDGVCQWSAPIQIDSAPKPTNTNWTYSRSYPKVGVDRYGNATVVWQGFDSGRSSIRASRYDIGTGWQTPQTIDHDSDGGASASPDVAVMPSGDAYVVWGQVQGMPSDGSNWPPYTGVLFTHYDPQSGWETTAQLVEEGTTFASDFRIELIKDTLFAVWIRDGREIHSSRQPLGSPWTTPDRIDSVEMNMTAYAASIIGDSKGNAIAVWLGYAYDGYQMFSSRYDATGATWQEPFILGQVGGASYAVDVDSSGNAFALWPLVGTTTSDLYLSRYRTDSGWSTPETASFDILFGADTARYDTYGNIVVAGYGAYETYSNEILPLEVTRYSNKRGWEAIERFTRRNTDPSSLHMVAGPNGHMAVLWEELNSEEPLLSTKLWLLRYIYNQGWQTPERLYAGPNGQTPLWSEIAIDAKGRVTVVWKEDSETEYVVRAMRFQ